MPDLGQSPPPSLVPGAAEIAHLQTARKPDGSLAFSTQDIAKYQADTSQTLLKAGFTPQQIDAHWGTTPPHSAEVSAYVANNVRQSGVTEAHGHMAAFEAGWGTSVAGIAEHMATGQDPNKAFQIKPDDGLLNSLAMAAGQQLGDLGTSILGFLGGATAGAAVPVAGETGASELVGGLAGAAGAGVASQGTREVLLDAYNRGQIHSVSDFLHVFGASTLRTLKAGAESAPFGLAGPIGGGVLKAGGGKALAVGAGVLGATTAGVGVGAALNQRMPNASDFVLAATVMLIAHGAFKAGSIVNGVLKPSPVALAAQHNLEEIYRRNGVTPWDAVNRARTDAGLSQEILQQDVNGNSVAPRTHANAPTEPPPIKHEAADAEPGPMKQTRVTGPKPAPIVTSFEDLSTALEGSRDDSVSPAGAIGKHQIMLGTARQYGFGQGMDQTQLAEWLHDPANNAEVFGKIAADLHARFHGDLNAMLIAYNAGPGRAGTYLTKGPGTELEAIPDKTARGGIRYVSQPSNRDEAWLPMETQKYLANGRRRSGGATEEGGTGLTRFPSWENQSQGAKEAAGEAAGGGGSGEPPRDDLLLPGPGEPGGRGFWANMNDDTLVEETLANIGEPPKPPSLLDPDRLMEQYVSELSPARNIDTALVKAGGFDRNMDIGQEDMFRQTYASDTRTGAFVRFGILRIGDGQIEIVKDSPSIMQATDEVRAAGGTLDEWKAYMLNKRTMDKAAQGVQTGFNPSVAEEMISRASFKKFAPATRTFNKVMDGGLEYARDSGLFSQKQIEAMQRDNPTYISMRRIMGDDESFGTGRRGFAARDPLHLMEGSDRQIIDPIYATIDNLRVLVAMSDRNRAVGSIIGQVEGGGLQHLGLEQLEFNPKATLAEPGSDVFKPYGLGAEGADDPEVTYQSLLAERAQKGLAPNEFIYYRDGIPERWRAKNPALVTLMRKAVGPGEANIIGKVFDTIASLDRAGVVLDPAFPTRVTLRHQITAFIADPLHPPPFITWMRGIHDVLTQNGVFQEWIANGGAGTALADMDVKWLQRDMETVFQDQGVFSRMWNTVQHPLQAYQFVSERIDAAARVGYYKQALESGRSPLKAATMSRKAMLDYAERASLAGVNSIARKVPFLRPKILGIKMFAEAVADRPVATAGYGAIGVLGLAVTAITAPTMLLYAANYHYDKELPEEERYSSIPRWIRDTHYITPPIAGTRIQFPFPFVVGTLFGGLTNRFLDHWAKHDPHAFDEWSRGLLSDYDPFNLLPAAIKTPIEAVANYNFMSGHAIVPSSVEAADGYMQYTNATTEPAKALSRWLGKPGLNLANFSPMQTEHWIDGWTGPVGMGVLRAVNGTMTDYKPPHQMADTPIVGTFFVRHPDLHAQQIEDFYTDLKAMEAAHADWSLALKHGDEGEIAEAARGPFYGLRIVGKMAAALRVMSASVQSINKDPTIRPEEKSQDIDQILSGMIQLSIMGSGITATLQGKDPGEAFKQLDKQRAMTMAIATTQ